MMEFLNTILFEMGGRPVLLIDLLSALFGLTTVFLAGRNNKYNFYVGYMYTALLFFMFWQKNLYANLILQPISLCPNTTYGESVGCVAVTKNASVVTITTTAFMCMILSFFSPLTTALQTIPSCVMGGVCLTLYGFIAVSGLKMLKDVDLGLGKNLFVVAAILISGIGKLKLQITDSIQITPIATALLLGILTNAVLNRVENGKKSKNQD